MHKILKEAEERHHPAVIRYIFSTGTPAVREVLSPNCICGFRWPCFPARLASALRECVARLGE